MKTLCLCLFCLVLSGLLGCQENAEDSNHQTLESAETVLEFRETDQESQEKKRIEAIASKGVSSVELTEVSLREALELTEKNSTDIYYCQDDLCIVGVGNYNDNIIGPITTSQQLVVYDLRADAPVKAFEVVDDVYVHVAVPCGEGILYNTVSVNADYGLPTQDWTVEYVSETEAYTVQTGTCRSSPIGQYIPFIVLLEDVPVFLYENMTEGGEYSYGISYVARGAQRWESYEIEKITPEKEKLLDTIMKSNGREFCYALANDGMLRYVIQDMDQVVKTMDVVPPVANFMLTEDALVCATDPQDGKGWCLRAYGIKDDSVVENRSGKTLYRLKPVGDHFLCIDTYFNLFWGTIKADGISMKTLKLPEELAEKPYIYYPRNEGSVFILFMQGDMDYFYTFELPSEE